MGARGRLTPGICLALTASLALVCGAAGAQELAADDTDVEVEEVVVTGTRIARKDFVGPSPITTVDQAELVMSGITNLEDALNVLPQVVADFDRSSNNPGDGTARVNLRGLGPQRTLAMVNGRRFVPSGVFGSVDVNNIPAALVERIEVVTGGGSAVYGSDAVTGVVNFIIKSDFEGLEANYQFDITDEGDGEVYDVNLTYGTPLAGGDGHVALFFNYNKRTSIMAGARPLTSVVLNEDIFTGEVSPGGSSFVPEGHILNSALIDGVLAGDGVIFNPDGTPRPFIDPDDRFNFAPDNFLVVPLDRWIIGAFAHYDLTPGIEAYFEGVFARNTVDQQLAPVPIREIVAINIDNPVIGAETRAVLADNFDPDGDGIANFLYGKRFVELGPRIIDNRRDTWRFVAGLKGDLPIGWRWDAYYSYSRVEASESLMNDGSASRFLQGLLVDPASGDCFDPSGGCVAVDPFGEGGIGEAAADFVRFDTFVNFERVEEQIFSAAVTGDVIELPAGALGFALGVEWRRLSSEFAADEILFSGDTLGFLPLEPVKGSFNVKDVFGEILVPIVDDLPLIERFGLEAGFRISDYSTSGTVTTWKAGGEWAPGGGIRFRGGFQRAVRAPNIGELFEGQVQFSAFFLVDFDQCSASRDPVGAGLTDMCVAQGLDPAQIGVFEAAEPFPAEVLQGGNTELDTEKADTVTAGVVYQPGFAPGLNASLDFYSIEITDAIAILFEDQVVSLCFLLRDPQSDFCQAFDRGPTGDISVVRVGQRNVARIKTQGLDLQINYRIDAPKLGLFGDGATISLWFLGNYNFKNGAQATPLVEFEDCAGFFGFPCDISAVGGALPEFRTTTRVTYLSGPLTVSLRWRWIDSMTNAFPEFGAARFGIPRQFINLAVPTVGDQSYFDLSFRYDINDNLELYGGATNLFDNGPPFLGANQVQVNTNPSTYDVIGRRFFIGITARY